MHCDHTLHFSVYLSLRLDSPMFWELAKPGNQVNSRIYGGWVKSVVPFYAICGPKLMKFSDDVEDP